MLEVVVFTGLQACGKTSFYRERFASSHQHVSKDNFPNHRRPSPRQEREIREALEAGASIVVDNTNPTQEERIVIVKLAKEFGARCVCYAFESDIEACKERNERRSPSVPPVALFSTIKKLTTPTFEEGFDEIVFVKLTPGGFVMERNGDES